MVIFRFLIQNGLKLELRTFAESRPLFLGFHWYEYVFWLFKVTLIKVTGLKLELRTFAVHKILMEH